VSSDVEARKREGGGGGARGGEGEENEGSLRVFFEVSDVPRVIDETKPNLGASSGVAGGVGVGVGGVDIDFREDVSCKRAIERDLLTFFSQFWGDNGR